jgi:hypothetical protein
MNYRHAAALTAIGLAMLATIGCKRTTTVGGRVTCDGQPVLKGNVSFQPADGRGPSCGGPIAAGRYRIEAAPGPKTVQITVLKSVRFDLSKPDEARYASEAAARGDNSGAYDCVDLTAANAQGNHTAVEIRTGGQTMDFTLTRTPTTSMKRRLSNNE